MHIKRSQDTRVCEVCGKEISNRPCVQEIYHFITIFFCLPPQDNDYHDDDDDEEKTFVSLLTNTFRFWQKPCLPKANALLSQQN